MRSLLVLNRQILQREVFRLRLLIEQTINLWKIPIALVNCTTFIVTGQVLVLIPNLLQELVAFYT